MTVWAVTFKALKKDYGVIHSFWDNLGLAHDVCDDNADLFYDVNEPGRWYPTQMPDDCPIPQRLICGAQDYMKMKDTAESLQAERAEDRQILQSIGSGSQDKIK
jgi:hypothetical protein